MIDFKVAEILINSCVQNRHSFKSKRYYTTTEVGGEKLGVVILEIKVYVQ
jgi:hypothetical protein